MLPCIYMLMLCIMLYRIQVVPSSICAALIHVHSKQRLPGRVLTNCSVSLLQKRSLQEQITEMEAAHISERENMLAQYQALLHQVPSARLASVASSCCTFGRYVVTMCSPMTPLLLYPPHTPAYDGAVPCGCALSGALDSGFITWSWTLPPSYSMLTVSPALVCRWRCITASWVR